MATERNELEKSKRKPHTQEWKENVSKKMKGKKPWNKGLTKETDKRVMKNAINKCGKNHPLWKGGRTIDKFGRPWLALGINGRMLESHYIWLQFNKLDKIPTGFEIHHINQGKEDNRIENLMLLSSSEHRKLHYKFKIKDNPDAKYFGRNKR